MTQTRNREDPRHFLPLKPDLFQILLALEGEDLHGYGLMKMVEKNTTGAIRLEPSPLYRRLKRLLEVGIVAEGDRKTFADSGGPQRRYYKLTPFGRSVLAAEAARVVALAENRLVRELAASAGRLG